MKNLEVEKMLERKPVMPLNLQYFAEKNDGKKEPEDDSDDDDPEEDDPEEDDSEDDPDDDDPADDSQEGSGKSGKGEKKFTKEEVNEIVRKRVLKERRELRKKNVKGKKTGNDGSKATDDDPENDDLNKERLRAEKAEKRLAYYERRDSALEAGVDKRFAKFVVHEVLELAEDEDDFEDALEEYLEENPQYLEEKKNDSDPDEEEPPKKRKPKFSTNSKDGEDKGKKSYKPPKII